MAIPDADPRAQDLDAAFAAAMDAPARPVSAAKTPGEVDHDAPHGRDEHGVPLAPFGLTLEGKPKRAKGGRPPKDDPDRPRTGTVTELKAADDPKPKPKPEPRDYSEDLSGLANAAWFGLSAVAKVGGSVPFLGKLIPGTKLAAQAFIISETSPQLIGAVNLAAQHNAKAAAFCSKLEGGDGLWALQCMFMVMPVISLSATIWRGDEAALKENELPSLAEMAARNETKMDDMLASIQAQIAAAAEPPAAA